MKSKLFVAVSALSILFLVGCSKPIRVKIIKVSPPLGEDALYYIHRTTHTLVESDSERFILPGDLGEIGDEFFIRRIPAQTLYR